MEFKTSRERRYAFFAVSPELLLQALFNPTGDEWTVSVEGLPDGCEATDIVWDFERRAFLIRVWHESFAIVPECDRIPQITPQCTMTKRHKTQMREFL